MSNIKATNCRQHKVLANPTQQNFGPDSTLQHSCSSNAHRF